MGDLSPFYDGLISPRTHRRLINVTSVTSLLCRAPKTSVRAALPGLTLLKLQLFRREAAEQESSKQGNTSDQGRYEVAVQRKCVCLLQQH